MVNTGGSIMISEYTIRIKHKPKLTEEELKHLYNCLAVAIPIGTKHNYSIWFKKDNDLPEELDIK